MRYSTSTLIAVLATTIYANAAPFQCGIKGSNSTFGSHFANGNNGFKFNGTWGHGSNWGNHASGSYSPSQSAVWSQAAPPTDPLVVTNTASPSQSSISGSLTATTTFSDTSTPISTVSTGTSGTSGDNGSTTAVLASDSDIAQTLISLHNKERADYGASPVSWNDSLATYATNWADKCGFKHSGGPNGENLAAGTGSGYTVTDAFNSWAYENSSYTTPGFSETTGHFTQVVWKSTTTIGCAWVPCAAGTIFASSYGTSQYLVCEYYPAGNIVGGTNNDQYFIENVGSFVR